MNQAAPGPGHRPGPTPTVTETPRPRRGALTRSRHHAHTQPPHPVDARVVAPQGGVCHGVGSPGVRAAFHDVHVHPDQPGGRGDPAAVGPDRLAAGQHRLEPGVGDLEPGVGDTVRRAAFEQVVLERPAHGFDAQRARLHRVLEEVGPEEPGVRTDVVLRTGGQIDRGFAAGLVEAGPVVRRSRRTLLVVEGRPGEVAVDRGEFEDRYVVGRAQHPERLDGHLSAA